MPLVRIDDDDDGDVINGFSHHDDGSVQASLSAWESSDIW